MQHLAIASLNIGFGGENGGGSYHSAFDSFDHYTRFQDPGFAYGKALGQVGGRLTLRMANADVLPLRLTNWIHHASRYVAEVQQLARTMREDTERHNRLVASNAFVLAHDPRQPFVAPPSKDPVPHLNFAPLRNSLAALTERAHNLDAALAMRRQDLGSEQLQILNGILRQLERAMSREEGLPGRPWYRHHIYAPGVLTGYGVKTLPGVREAIEGRSWKQADAQIEVAATVLDRVTEEINRALQTTLESQK